MSKSSNNNDLSKLKHAASLSILKKSRGAGNSVSIAVSSSGKEYLAGKIESDTNLLDITSEQAALAVAIAHRDYNTTKIVTLIDSDTATISPLTLKVLADFSVRSGKPVRYIVQNQVGKVLFKTTNPQKEISFYTPPKEKLTLAKKRLVHNFKQIDSKLSEKTLINELKKLALIGLKSAFITKDGSSRYGVAVATAGGRIYFAGQYSSPDKRLGLHAEVSALLTALMNGEREITHLALVSEKFTDTPASVCGCCRQWLSELAHKFNWKLKILCFAKDTPDYRMDTIEKLLPEAWSSNTE